MTKLHSFVGVLAATSLLAGAACARRDEPPQSAGTRDSFGTDSVVGVDSAWTTLRANSESNGYAVNAEGYLSWRGRRLSPALPAASDSVPRTYAIAPRSPSGRWALAQASDATFGRLFVLDLEAGVTRETAATKYGITHWVAWAPGLPYAIVSNRLEGTALLYVIDLTTGAARQLDFSTVVRPPLSVTPSESSLKWLDAEAGVFAIEGRVACNSAVERCEGTAPSETRAFRVDVRTLRITEQS
ncbi:MAG TPA: hypothetical protein VJ717_10510 [Gemmatimonadaceae bacterium]|nr:hypothetical protein [Gemmatimonadaceae bacterium]